MSVKLESAERLSALKQGIEAKTGETYTDMTGAVNALIAGYGQGGGGNNDLADVLGRSIVDLENSDVLTLGDYALYNSQSLRRVLLSECTAAGSNAVYNCASLVEVILPRLLSTGGRAFGLCSSLGEISLPSLNVMGFAAFGGCTALRRVELFQRLTITAATFENCGKLEILVLRSAVKCGMQNVNAFKGTPFAVGGTGGTVYVPEELIESYKTETNWVTLYEAGTCNFVAIEGSEYE